MLASSSLRHPFHRWRHATHLHPAPPIRYSVSSTPAIVRMFHVEFLAYGPGTTTGAENERCACEPLVVCCMVKVGHRAGSRSLITPPL